MSNLYVFCGGGAYATPQMGVVEYMLENNILQPDDVMVGTSFGSISVACLSSKFSNGQIEALLNDFNQQVTSLWGIGLFTSIFQFFYTYGLRNIKTVLAGYIPNVPVPSNVGICATDLSNYSRQFFDGKSAITLLDAVSASTSIPVIFTPQKINDTFYVDGGIIDNCPLDFQYEKHFDHVISIGGGYVSSLNVFVPTDSLSDYLMALLNGMISKLNYYNLNSKNLVLGHLNNVVTLSYQTLASNILDFSHWQADVQNGYESAKQFWKGVVK
ncbi:MAG: patatin-like phospholipase family protein [Thermoplasmataceae archaeon]